MDMLLSRTTMVKVACVFEDGGWQMWLLCEILSEATGDW